MSERPADAPADPGDSGFVVTKEYRRFAEFCDACRRHRYIGLCHGSPGVGKTMSARAYARSDLFETYAPQGIRAIPPPEARSLRTVFYTPPVSNSPRRIEREVGDLRLQLLVLTEAAAHHREWQGRDWKLPADVPNRIELLLVDETDRLKMPGLEQLRDLYDRHPMGLIFIGMPGIELRLARYAQLYSRVGFVHQFRPLSLEEARFVITEQWHQLGLSMQPEDFTDAEAMAAMLRITGGNFRLMQRLLTQIERILHINELHTVTKEVVEAARESLVIGLA